MLVLELSNSHTVCAVMLFLAKCAGVGFGLRLAVFCFKHNFTTSLPQTKFKNFLCITFKKRHKSMITGTKPQVFIKREILLELEGGLHTVFFSPKTKSIAWKVRCCSLLLILTLVTYTIPSDKYKPPLSLSSNSKISKV